MRRPGIKRAKPRYLRQWAASLALLASAALVYSLYRRAGAPDVRRQYAGGSADWFLILRMPEVPFTAPQASAVRYRFGQWLDALSDSGFKPIFLSQARRSLLRRARLPEKAVVLLFEPGYRQTYEALSPMLERLRFPASWITDAGALERLDQRYLSLHAVRRMRDSGLWEIGSFRSSSATFTLDAFWGSEGGPATALAWRGETGRHALNRASGLGSLDRLNVNVAWTGRQFIERLRAEIPVQGASYLGTTRILGRWWGVAIATASVQTPPLFDLQALPDGRSAYVGWHGTSGLDDFRLELRALSVVGELGLHLRYDHESDSGIKVRFSPGAVLVERSRGEGRGDLLANISWSTRPGGSLDCSLELDGPRLRLFLPAARPYAINLPPDPGNAGRGVVALMVYGNIRGTARAKSVGLLVTPAGRRGGEAVDAV